MPRQQQHLEQKHKEEGGGSPPQDSVRGEHTVIGSGASRPQSRIALARSPRDAMNRKCIDSSGTPGPAPKVWERSLMRTSFEAEPTSVRRLVDLGGLDIHPSP